MKRTRACRMIAALSFGLILASFIPQPAGAKAETGKSFVTGSGSAYAQIYRVGPTAGRLSLAPIVGLSLADYLNTVGRGESKIADYAGLGVAERSLPDNTPSLKSVSTEKDSEKGKTLVVAGQSDGATGGGAAELYVRSTDAPLGEGRFRLSSLSIPGLIEVFDSQSRSIVGVVNGNVRESIATTDMGRVKIAGGMVTLSGLHWESIQRTGAKKAVTGKFTIEGATVAGLPLAIPAGGAELKTVLGPINAALAPTGFAISLPVFENRNNQSSVSPLSMDIVNSSLGRQFLAPIIEQIRPVREPVADAFIDLAKQLVETNESIPDLTVGVLAADLTVGIFSGSSQLHIELGGVSAFTEGETFDSPFGSGVQLRPVGATPAAPFSPGTAGTPGTPGAPSVVGEPPVEGEFAAAPSGVPGTRTVPGGKGGAAVLVGLIGLGIAAALATRDYWKMRQYRREAITT